MKTTRELEYGDMVQRRLDGRFWVFFDAVDYSNNVYTMKFFDLQLKEVIRYTSPWGMSLPEEAFTVI